MPGAHQSCSIIPLPQLDRGEENSVKGLRVELRTGTGRAHSEVTVKGKSD